MADAQRVICSSAELAEKGEGVRFEVNYHGELIGAFAVRYHGKAYAYLNRCAHVAVELDWQPGRFFDIWGMHLICSTHGAIYAPESGRCRGGPCRGGSLVPLTVEECDGQVIYKGY